MSNILFFIGLFITIVLAGSYLIVIWGKNKKELYKQQIEDGIKIATEMQKAFTEPLRKMVDEAKINNDKEFKKNMLKLKLDKERKLKQIDEETIDKLIAAGMSRNDAINFLKNRT